MDFRRLLHESAYIRISCPEVATVLNGIIVFLFTVGEAGHEEIRTGTQNKRMQCVI